MPSLLRSFVAVIAGYMVMMVVVVALTIIFVKTMGQHSGHPTPAYLAVNLVYSFLAACVGGFVTGSVARTQPIRHAAVLGGLMFVLSMVSYRNFHGEQPFWYQVVLTVVPPLCAVTGAALSIRNTSATIS